MAKFEFCIFISLVLFQYLCNATDLRSCKFDQIYQLGDSFADTGNYIRESSTGAASVYAKLPYGKNFNRTPTGRCSDGQLILDYIATSSGLEFINPYKNTNASFRNGDNFATTGATALPVEMLAAKGIKLHPLSSTSLEVQTNLMFTHFNSICLRDCTQLLRNALFVVGHIGFNDYGLALFQGKSFQETRGLVPDVVFAVQKAIRTVIEYGAISIVVPGSYPLGCFPVFLTRFQSNTTTDYDEYGCLKSLNELSKYHNQQLESAIGEVQKENSTVTIIYGDSYNAYINLLSNAKKTGPDSKNTHLACCGTGGNYNFDITKLCGNVGVGVCIRPDDCISWDGIHMTQQAHKELAQFLIDHDILPKLKCNA